MIELKGNVLKSHTRKPGTWWTKWDQKMALFSWNLYVKLLFTACVRAEYFFNHGNTLTLCGDPNMKFLSFGNISLSSCITECGRRPKCFALNHRPLYSNFCELFETRDTIANVNRDCLYIRRDDISFSDEVSVYLFVCLSVRLSVPFSPIHPSACLSAMNYGAFKI